MKKEIRIIYSENYSKDQKGNFFEDIVRNIFESQRYAVTQRVNFTGMEIDLIAKHKDKNDTAYIECKAKSNLSSDEIKTFCFNVGHHNADYGYFLSTIEFEHQVAGLIEEIKVKPKYSNLYFWGPEKIFELLIDSKIIKPLDVQSLSVNVTKMILIFTYVGTFYICIVSDGTIPKSFIVYKAKELKQINESETVSILQKNIEEIQDLESHSNLTEKKVSEKEAIYETVTEVNDLPPL